MSYDCFISYASADREHAEVLYRRLTAVGFSVWFDRVQLAPPVKWHEEIERHCEDSRVVLPVLTPRWKLSDWTRYETYGAEVIIPIVVEGQWKDIVTPPLARWQSDQRLLGDWEPLFSKLRMLLKQPPPSKSDRVVNLPYRPNPFFCGREDDLVNLHEKLFINQTTALTQGRIEAVTALGGVGKTTLVREYAEKFWRCYRQMFWVDCRENLTTSFARVYEALRPQESGLADPEKAARALRELSRADGPDRLLILDNAENEQSILEWLPKTGKCHTLITSRFTAWSPGISTVPVWVLRPEPATDFLLKRTDTADVSGAAQLSAKLGFLPLALEQAGAYIKEESLSFRQYIALYERHEREMLDDGRRGSTEYPASVYVTWRTTMTQPSMPEGARALMRIHAFMAPTAFPTSICVAAASMIASEAGLSGASEIDVRSWLKALASYSMIRRDGDSFTVHALVQSVERHSAGERYGELSTKAAMLLSDHVPEPSWEPGNRQLWLQLIPHAEKTLEGALTVRSILACGSLLNYVSLAHKFRGSYAEAAKAAERHLASCRSLLGDKSRSTLAAKNNLASCLQAAGRLAEAEPLYTEVIKAHRLAGNHETSEALSVVNNLATLLQDKGDFEAAEPLLRQALAGIEKLEGKEHDATLRQLNNLGYLLQLQGSLQEAETLFRRAVRGYESHSDDEPEKQSTLNNLGILLSHKGDMAEAEQLFRRVLELRKRVLGDEHPLTLTSLNNLAELLSATDRLSESEPMHRLALTTRERILGPLNTETLQSVDNLGLLMFKKGDLDASESLSLRAVAGYEKVLGTDHPDTLIAIHNLACVYRQKGDFPGAAKQFRRLLGAKERRLGLRHPDVLDTAGHLGVVSRAMGDVKGAEQLYRRAVEGLKAEVGEDDPRTLTAANNLGGLLCARGDLDKAEPYFDWALRGRDRALGKDHPETILSVNNMAFLLLSKGDAKRAEPLYRRALDGFLRIYGPGDPRVQSIQVNHATCLRALGKK